MISKLFTLANVVVIGLMLCCVSPLFAPSVYADPDPPHQTPHQLCPHGDLPAPFTGLNFCDDAPDFLCAAVASLLTWYPTDWSVDSGYDRARSLFVAQGWRDPITNLALTPATNDALSVSPPLNLVPIWNYIHHNGHVAIAYAFGIITNSRVSATQYEFLPSQLDSHMIPYPDAQPIHARHWILFFDSDWDNIHNDTMRVKYLTPWLPRQGTIIDHNHFAGPVTYSGFPHMQGKGYPLIVSLPHTSQTLGQRWGCSDIDRIQY